MAYEPFEIDGRLIADPEGIRNATLDWAKAGKSNNLAALSKEYRHWYHEQRQAMDEALEAVIGDFVANDKAFLLPSLFRGFDDPFIACDRITNEPVPSGRIYNLTRSALRDKAGEWIEKQEDEKITSVGLAFQTSPTGLLGAFQDTCLNPFVKLAATDRGRLFMLLAYIGTPRGFVREAIKDRAQNADPVAIVDVARKIINLEGPYQGNEASLRQIAEGISAGFNEGVGQIFRKREWGKITTLADGLEAEAKPYRTLYQAIALNIVSQIYPPRQLPALGIWARGKNARARRQREWESQNTPSLRLRRARSAVDLGSAIQDHPDLRELLSAGIPNNTIAYAANIFVSLEAFSELGPLVELCKKDDAWRIGLSAVVGAAAKKWIEPEKSDFQPTSVKPDFHRLGLLAANIGADERVASVVDDKIKERLDRLKYDYDTDPIIEFAEKFPGRSAVIAAAHDATAFQTANVLGWNRDSEEYSLRWNGPKVWVLQNISDSVKAHPTFEQTYHDAFGSTIDKLIEKGEWGGISHAYFQVSDAEGGDRELLRILNERLDNHGVVRSFVRHDERPLDERGYPDFMSELPAFSAAVFLRRGSEPVAWLDYDQFDREKGSPVQELLARIEAAANAGPSPKRDADTLAVIPRVLSEAVATVEAGAMGRGGMRSPTRTPRRDNG